MEEKIKQLVAQNKTYKEIAKELNISEGTVYNKIKKLGIGKRGKNISKQEIKEIVDKINKGYTYTKIAKEHNKTVACISSIAKRHNCKYNGNRKREHFFNENYFEVINTEHKAYWLGFIIADGGVSKTYKTDKYDANRLYINISNNDRKLLEKFCDDIEQNKNLIKVYNSSVSYSTNTMCKIQLDSVKLCSDLSTYGVVPNKTGKEKFIILDDELMPHFIRGFFDGDGTVFKSKKMIHVGFSGNYNFINDLKKYLKSKDIIKNKNKIIQEKRNNCNCCYYSFANKKDVQSFYNYIYKNATIYLERKHNKFS